MPRRRRNRNKNLPKEEEIPEASNCDVDNNNNNDDENKKKEKKNKDDDGVDKISPLPDDTLISIISRLTVAEAVRTSVLSTRWWHLHKYITRLHFSSTTIKQFERIITSSSSSDDEEEEEQQQPQQEDEEQQQPLQEEDEEQHEQQPPQEQEQQQQPPQQEEQEEQEEEEAEEEEEEEEEEEKEKEKEKYSKFDEREACKEEFLAKYASVIDHTLDSYKGGAIIEEFRLHIPWFIDTYHYNDGGESDCPKERCLIQRWLEFAFSQRVKIIDIRLDCSHKWARFPFLSCKNEHLKEISLTAVDVDDEAFELLLSNSVALERLSVERSYKLSVVRILGDFVARKVKHLSINDCYSIKSIEIRDVMNLESLRCQKLPRSYKLLLENVPRLVDLDTCRNIMIQILSQGIISEQLWKLSLLSDPYHHISYDDVDDMRLPKLVKLKHMVLDYAIFGDRSIRELIHFIESCPNLQTLEIEFLWNKCPHKYTWDTTAQYRIKAVSKTPIENLKSVKLWGLLGCPRELEFGSYIIRKATALEEMFAQTCSFHTYVSERKAISRVWKYFRRVLPKSVKLDVE